MKEKNNKYAYCYHKFLCQLSTSPPKGTPKGARRESMRPSPYGGSISEQYDDTDYDMDEAADRVVQ